MAKLNKSILIAAPAEKIFAYMNDPKNLTEIWPSMQEIKDVKTLPNGGVSFKFGYKMAGIRLEASSEDTEFILNQRTVSKMAGGIEGWTTFVYEAQGQGTKVSLEMEYLVPLPVIGKLAEAVIIKMNEHEAEMLLVNLKARMELAQ
jgi:uncharacterized membrane protein